MNTLNVEMLMGTLNQFHILNSEDSLKILNTEKIYNTQFNDLNIQVVSNAKENFDANKISKVDKIIFISQSDSKELFTINFAHSKNLARQLSASITVDNVQVTNQNSIDNLLQSVNFNKFIEHEIKQVENKTNDIKNNKCLKEKLIADNLIYQAKLQPNLDKLDLLLFIETIQAIGNDLNYNQKEFNILETSYNSTFENFNISHTIQKDKRAESNHSIINITDHNQGINFSIHIKNEKDYGNSITIDINGKELKNFEVVQEIIKTFKIDTYANDRLKEIEFLKTAKIVQTEVNDYLSSKIVNQKIEKNLGNSQLKDSMDLSNMPINLNGKKIWINKEMQLHRDDGPAIETQEGQSYYFTNGNAYIAPEQKQEIYQRHTLVEEKKLLEEKMNLALQEKQSQFKTSNQSEIPSLIQRLRNGFLPNESSVQKDKYKI